MMKPEKSVVRFTSYSNSFSDLFDVLSLQKNGIARQTSFIAQTVILLALESPKFATVSSIVTGPLTKTPVVRN